MKKWNVLGLAWVFVMAFSMAELAHAGRAGVPPVSPEVAEEEAQEAQDRRGEIAVNDVDPIANPLEGLEAEHYAGLVAQVNQITQRLLQAVIQGDDQVTALTLALDPEQTQLETGHARAVGGIALKDAPWSPGKGRELQVAVEASPLQSWTGGQTLMIKDPIGYALSAQVALKTDVVALLSFEAGKILEGAQREVGAPKTPEDAQVEAGLKRLRDARDLDACYEGLRLIVETGMKDALDRKTQEIQKIEAEYQQHLVNNPSAADLAKSYRDDRIQRVEKEAREVESLAQLISVRRNADGKVEAILAKYQESDRKGRSGLDSLTVGLEITAEGAQAYVQGLIIDAQLYPLYRENILPRIAEALSRYIAMGNAPEGSDEEKELTLWASGYFALIKGWIQRLDGVEEEGASAPATPETTSTEGQE